ncbi:HAD family hydrolase [Bacillus sp. FJAT-22090]|uniref:HAD family hydrolase n=1 Tax=Bacillus sp. FJAT-22090 TaxID=1581038 RepID=UPI0021B48E32|nr:HAD family hydrolase [Bacillus sp. FJAT-22090]
MREKNFVLATDLDGTLVGDNSALCALLQHFEESSLQIALVYITGRHLASASTLILEEKLPKPDVLITDIGTAIYTSPSLSEEKAWTEKMKSNWDPNEIIKISEKFPLLKRQALPTDDRISFTIHQNEEIVKEFKNALFENNIPHKFVYSSNRDVDILPLNSGKGEALVYTLQNYFKDNVQILIAGDSGNDLDMLSLDYPSVVVGNAQKELVEMDNHPLLYRATKQFAGGIHEGWLHFYN